MAKILRVKPPGSRFQTRYTYQERCSLHPKYRLRLVTFVSGEH